MWHKEEKEKSVIKLSSQYIEMYLHPIVIAMDDLEKGIIKDRRVITVITDLLADEQRPKKEYDF